MSSAKTTVSELGTAVGMLGDVALDGARPPPALVNVTTEKWEQFVDSVERGEHADLYHRSIAGGRAFLSARDGLRGRKPLRIEWKGDHRPVGFENLPADLRVDHVYLVSCKDGSRILSNPSPVQLFDHSLRGTADKAIDWYATVDLEAYEAFYQAVRSVVDPSLPSSVLALHPAQRETLKRTLPGRWPLELRGPYHRFCRAIETATVARWQRQLSSKPEQELMFWRLIRLASAPYFLLGSVGGEDIRLRVGTPWDWRQAFAFVALRVDAAGDSGQPTVRWRAEVRQRSTGDVRHVDGHVEVRWSKGRFRQAPESKVYLDSRHADVAGYFAID